MRIARAHVPARHGVHAPMVLDGPVSGLNFLAWAEQHLTRVLRPGDIVILDNLSSRKSRAVRNAVRTAGAWLWFLPPYSPDLNPIEQLFAKIKHWMRMAQMRGHEETWRHLRRLIGTITPQECQNCIRSAGYDTP